MSAGLFENNISLDIELHYLIFTMMDIMMNILHEIHKLYPGPQETPFISEATDFPRIILIFISKGTYTVTYTDTVSFILNYIRAKINKYLCGLV